MNQDKSSFRNRILALTLILALMLSLLSGCGQKSAATTVPFASIDAEGTTPPVSSTSEPECFPVPSPTVTEEPLQSGGPEEETDWAEVSRALIINDYSLCYDVFDAAVVLSDGTEIIGIGYSDFGLYFESEDGNRDFFPAGFLSECAELPISEKEYNNGLVVYNLDY